MTKDEFFCEACLKSISILTPAYWDSTCYNNDGTDKVIDFAKKLTEKVWKTRKKL